MMTFKNKFLYLNHPVLWIHPFPLTCLLKKALYDLKQALRVWFHKLASALSTLGFKASQSKFTFYLW
jgi:hypothetical protein